MTGATLSRIEEAGVVVVQYRDEGDARAVEDAVSDDLDRVLVAPNPALGERVVATAWERRLPLSRVDDQTLRAFVTARAGLGPDPSDCTT